ncbi:MAG: IS66 family transposase [Candidatus Doudnabacteria bacterium]|nr:IS66 family transposase [Candidatus Doudnabacteria bacterium]
MPCRQVTECEELAAANKQVKELEAENRILKYDLAEMRNKWFSRKSKKKKAGEEEKEPKKKGAPVGHPGWYRKKPERIDKVKHVNPEKCSHCGGRNVAKYDNKTEEHIQEDIVFLPVKVTKYIHHYGYCYDCKEIFCPRGEDELLLSYIGPTAKAFAAFLKNDIKMSERDIQRLFEKTWGLKVDASSIVGFRNQLARAGYPLYREILKEIKASPVVNADETGWSMDGKNWWLWKLASPSLSFTHIDPSRGQKVVEKLLGSKFDGVLISDFLSAYDKIEARAKQKCVPHLDRDLEKAEKCYADDEIIRGYCSRLRDLFEQARKLKEAWVKDEITDQTLAQRREPLVKQLEDFYFPNPQKGILQTISKRLIKHKNNLFTFLYYKNVPYHNNHAELQIRSDVLLRKIIFCSRSLKGTLTHSVLSTIIQTSKLNQKDPMNILKMVLLAEGKQKNKLLPFIRAP